MFSADKLPTHPATTTKAEEEGSPIIHQVLSNQLNHFLKLLTYTKCPLQDQPIWEPHSVGKVA